MRVPSFAAFVCSGRHVYLSFRYLLHSSPASFPIRDKDEFGALRYQLSAAKALPACSSSVRPSARPAAYSQAQVSMSNEPAEMIHACIRTYIRMYSTCLLRPALCGLLSSRPALPSRGRRALISWPDSSPSRERKEGRRKRPSEKPWPEITTNRCKLGAQGIQTQKPAVRSSLRFVITFWLCSFLASQPAIVCSTFPPLAARRSLVIKLRCS